MEIIQTTTQQKETVLQNCILAQRIVLKRSKQEATEIALENLKKVGKKVEKRKPEINYSVNRQQKSQ